MPTADVVARYAVASIGCTIGLLLSAVFGSFAAKGFASGCQRCDVRGRHGDVGELADGHLVLVRLVTERSSDPVISMVDDTQSWFVDHLLRIGTWRLAGLLAAATMIGVVYIVSKRPKRSTRSNSDVTEPV